MKNPVEYFAIARPSLEFHKLNEKKQRTVIKDEIVIITKKHKRMLKTGQVEVKDSGDKSEESERADSIERECKRMKYE